MGEQREGDEGEQGEADRRVWSKPKGVVETERVVEIERVVTQGTGAGREQDFRFIENTLIQKGFLENSKSSPTNLIKYLKILFLTLNPIKSNG